MKFNNEIVLKNSTSIKSESIHDIMYFTSSNGITEVNLVEQKSYIIESPLNKLETILPDDFFYRINRQTIVNLMFIKCIHYEGKKEVILVNNTKFKLSKRRESRLIEQYYNITHKILN